MDLMEWPHQHIQVKVLIGISTHSFQLRLSWVPWLNMIKLWNRSSSQVAWLIYKLSRRPSKVFLYVLFCRGMLCISLKNLRSHMYQTQRGRAIWWPDDQLHCIVVRSSSKENSPTAPPDPPLDNVARPHTSNTRLDSIFVKGILNLSRHALPIRFDPTNSSNGANRFFYHYYVYFIFLL